MGNRAQTSLYLSSIYRFQAISVKFPARKPYKCPENGILYTGFTLCRSIFAVYLMTGTERFHCSKSRCTPMKVVTNTTRIVQLHLQKDLLHYFVESTLVDDHDDVVDSPSDCKPAWS